MFQGLVDTGSSATIITKSACERIGIREEDIKPYTSNLYSYSDTRITTVGCIELKVYFDKGEGLTHRFVVVPNRYMTTGVLLGFDLISRKPFTWEPVSQNFVWNEMMFKFQTNTLYTVGKVTVRDKVSKLNIVDKGIPLQLKRKLKLKQGELIWLPFKGEEVKGNLEIIATTVKPIGRTLLLAKQLIVETDLEAIFHVPVYNSSLRDVCIPNGTIIGYYVQVPETDLTYMDRSGKMKVGSLKDILSDQQNNSLNLCPTHFHIITNSFQDVNVPHNTPTLVQGKLGECDICDRPNKVNMVNKDIVNDMLPHTDAEGIQPTTMSKVEKLKKLVDQLDLKHLGSKDRLQLEETLVEHVELFILDDLDMGCIQVPDSHIAMEDNCPVRMPLYRHPEQAKEIIEEMIGNMLDKDIIENSCATYLSPIVLINKPNGSKRMCIDYRGVNKHIKMDIHPLPRLDELVDDVAGNKYYCTLDLKDAYYQCKLDEESRDITTFSDGKNLYRFKRLPFGLNVAPAIFTRVMQEVLRPLLKLGFVKNYLDDVIIFAHDYETLLQRLTLTFKRMAEMGLKLNVSKCHFAQRKIKFLGHIVSSKGVEVNPENVEGILKMEPPKSTREVRRFIGMCSFYRKFITNFSQIAAPLTTLQSKLVKFSWSPECQEAFEKLKDKLMSTPVLVKADLSKDFELHTDASNNHVGAVLMQREDEGLKPIGYFSKKLNRCEKKYCCTDKEALGIIKATRFFHHYLWGKQFSIITDHQPLTSVFKKKTHSPRMSRYMLEMRDYSFTIIYKRGATNYVPDALSRPSSKNPKVQVIQDRSHISKFPGLSPDRIKDAQRKDKRWKKVIDFCEGGRIPNRLPGNRTLNCFEMRDGLLYLRREEFRRFTLCLVIPESLRSVACSIIHNETHLGQHKSVRRAQQYFYWPRMWSDIVHFVRSCTVCQQFKESGALVQKWQELPTVEDKGKRIAIDLIDMHNSCTGHRYCLTVMDHFSRFLRVYPIRNKSAKLVLRELRKDMCMFGTPEVALMDNGSEFTSREFRTFVNQVGIKQVMCLPYHPRGNSVLERAHRTLKSVLSMLSREHPNFWPKHLPEAVKVLNESVHTSLGTSPFFVQFGYHPLRLVGTLVLPEDSDEVDSENSKQIKAQIRETVKTQTDYYRNKANQSRGDDKLEVGDLAWIYKENHTPGTAVKMNRKWEGPYRVIQVIGEGRAYELVSTLSDLVVRRAAGKLKRYIPRFEILDEIEESFLTEMEEERILPEVRIRRPPVRYCP